MWHLQNSTQLGNSKQKIFALQNVIFFAFYNIGPYVTKCKKS